MGATGPHGGEARPARGARIGPYAIERRLGEGGMGTVYLARSRGGRLVAVKVARSELAADAHFRARFRAEVAAARAVGGFHTAPVVDADPDADPPWLATAYVPGPTLAERVGSQGPLGAREVRGLGAALAEALAAIHACGLVHRDLKPGNIIMAADGPRVLDFGIARAVEATRLTATGHAFGTPGFLAPEQATGADATGAADVFALGAVLVAAAGGSAFGTGTPMGVMYRSVHEAPDLSSVPAPLRELVASCLEKHPGDRPTPAQLLDRLDEMDLDGIAEAADGATEAADGATEAADGAAEAPDGATEAPDGATETPHGATEASRPATSYRLIPPRPPGPPYVPTVAAPAADRGPAQASAPDDGVFIAADKVSSIAVDSDGIMLTFDGLVPPPDRIVTDEDVDRDGTEIELSWPEIADIAHRTVGKYWLHVMITLHDGSVLECEISARRTARVDQWHRGLAEAVQRNLGR